MASISRLMAVLCTLAVPLLVEGQAAAAPAAAAAAGSIHGSVRAKKTGKPLVNALVILECTCMQDEATAMTGPNGTYSFQNLPAGNYTMRAIHDQVIANKTVELTRGGNQTVRFTLDPQKEETTVVHVTTNVRSDSATGIKLPAEALSKMGADGPSRSAVSGAIAVQAGAREDPNGVHTAGADTGTMNYVIDGLRTNDPGSGLSAVSSPTEFIGTIEVLGSGYSAEYGQVSGGQVTARRVSGGNKMRGVARFTFTPRLAQPRTIVGTDDAIRAIETPDWAMQGIVRVSGPFVGDEPETRLGLALQDRLFWVAGIFAQGSRATLRQTFNHRVDKDSSGGYEQCPYENGAFDCEEGKDFIATKQFADQTFPTRTVGGQALVGLDYFFNTNHRLSTTLRVEPKFQQRAFRRPLSSIDPDSLGASPNATIGGASTVANGMVNDHFGWDQGSSVGASIEYAGRVHEDKIEIDASAGFLQTKYEEAWRLENPEYKLQPSTQTNDGRGKSLFELLDIEGKTGDVPGVAEACNDSDLPGLSCPVRSWVSGGIGQFSKSVARRYSADLSLTHFFNAAGAHQLKYGTQFEHLARSRKLQYSGSNESDFYTNCNDAGLEGGGEFCYDRQADQYSDLSGPGRVNNNRQIFVGGNNPNVRTTRGFGRVQHERGSLRAISDPLGNGARVEAYDERVSTQNYGVFLQDSWAIIHGLYLDAGVRWEVQDMRDVLGRPAIRIWDNVGPRVGLVYDWTQEGRSRLFANYGWFYQQMPLSLINRVYGGLVDVSRTYDHSDCEGNSVTGPDGNARPQTVRGQPTEFCSDFGQFTSGLMEGATVPRLRGQYDQALQLGYQHEIVEDLTLEVSWQHRDLGRAVEDISTDGGSNFLVANPGVSVGAEAIAQQQSQCDALGAELEAFDADDPGRSALARELQRCEFLVDAYGKVDTLFAKPKRNYDAFTFQLVKRWAGNWMLVGSYTYSRLVGNYGGFIDPVSGAVNVGDSTQYDLPELVRNNFGPLPFDIRHQAQLNGFYTFDLQEAGALTLGSGLQFQSGTPLSMRVSHTRYPVEFPTNLLPRGSGGRLQPNYQLNLNVEYAYPIADAMALGVAIRLFNVTNARAVLQADQVYSVQTAAPIAGGDLSDLKHAKVDNPGRPGQHFQRGIVEPQGNFGVETAFQLPLAAQFDVRLNF